MLNAQYPFGGHGSLAQRFDVVRCCPVHLSEFLSIGRMACSLKFLWMGHLACSPMSSARCEHLAALPRPTSKHDSKALSCQPAGALHPAALRPELFVDWALGPFPQVPTFAVRLNLRGSRSLPSKLSEGRPIRRGPGLGVLLERSRWFRGRAAAVLLSGVLLFACVSPAQLPQQDPQLSSQSSAVLAIEEVLIEQGYPPEQVAADGAWVQSAWRELGDARGRRARVRIRLNETSMGLALAARVEFAEAVQTPLVEDRLVMYAEGRHWVVRPGSRDEEKAEELRLAELIRERWRHLSRSAGSSP